MRVAKVTDMDDDLDSDSDDDLDLDLDDNLDAGLDDDLDDASASQTSSGYESY